MLTALFGLSSDIQNKIIYCITTTIEDEIKAMITKTSFVAVMFDETMDLQMNSQLSHVFQFVNEKEKSQERLLGYIDVSKNRRAPLVTEEILKLVNGFRCSQTYSSHKLMMEKA